MALSSERLFDSLGHFGRYWGCPAHAAVAPGHPRAGTDGRPRWPGVTATPGGHSARRAPRVLTAPRRLQSTHTATHRPSQRHMHSDCHTHTDSDTGAYAHRTAVYELTPNRLALPLVFAALYTPPPRTLFHTHASARSHRAAQLCVCRAHTGTRTAPVPTWPHGPAGTTCIPTHWARSHTSVALHSETLNTHTFLARVSAHTHAHTQSPRVWNSLCASGVTSSMQGSTM